MPNRRTLIGVRPAAALAKHGRLFAALESAFSVRFVALRDTDEGTPDGALVLGQDLMPSGQEASAAGVPMLVLAGESDAADRRSDVRLVAKAAVDRRLWNIVLLGQVGAPPLQPSGGDEDLALRDGRPVWTRRELPVQVDRVSAQLPVLGEGMTLFRALHGEHSLGLLALVQFLRTLNPERWSGPRVRCAFVFDDPNLRWTRYGYLDYRRLLRHADDHGYHVAMAMIPLDAQCRSKDAVAMFRARSDRLSLVMHGNDHAQRELGNTHNFPAALALGAQALRRIAQFECATGLSVDRVMMPPHAVWSHLGARAIGALGYDALCATLPGPTTEESDGRAVGGWTPADFVDGCAVIPRVSMSVGRTGIALRAFLGQPLVLYGHHGDVASGLEPLAATAAAVNDLGDVCWCSVGEIVHSNHELYVHDGTAVLRPWGQRLRVVIPRGVHELTVQEPLGAGAATGLSGWTVSRGGPRRSFSEAAPVSEGELFVRLHTDWDTDPQSIASAPRSLSAVWRRRVTEMRDQLAPLYRPRLSA